MAFVPAHYQCDWCEHTVLQDDLKPVPVQSGALTMDFCSTCRTNNGWTEEKRVAAIEHLRAVLAGEVKP